MIDPATATGSAAEMLAAVQSSLGVTPNMTKAMANSPALVAGYVALAGALDSGVLTIAVRARLALAVAQGNSCAYCLPAHSYLAERVAGLDAAETIGHVALNVLTNDSPRRRASTSTSLS